MDIYESNLVEVFIYRDKGFSFTCVCSYMVNVGMHACLRVKEKQKAKGHHDRPGYYKKSNISH